MNSIFLLDKPLGISSNQALQKVKRFLRVKKAGHTGSLDPLATGMLPICIGEATKFSQYLLAADKTYLVSMQLGVRTTTSDAEGMVISTRAVPDMAMDGIDRAFDFFRGETQQIPSMFSAIKYQGVPLYEYARQGVTVERKARPITIYDLSVLYVDNPIIRFFVKCSTGTYVRTLVDDFGERLGCGAHVTALRRLSVGTFLENQMVTLEQLTASQDAMPWMIPMEAAVSHFPVLSLSQASAQALRYGKKVPSPDQTRRGLVRLMEAGEDFFGIGEVLSDNMLVSRRLISTVNN